MTQKKLFLKDKIKGDVGNDPADVLVAALLQGIITEKDFKESIQNFPKPYKQHIYSELNKRGCSLNFHNMQSAKENELFTMSERIIY